LTCLDEIERAASPKREPERAGRGADQLNL